MTHNESISENDLKLLDELMTSHDFGIFNDYINKSPCIESPKKKLKHVDSKSYTLTEKQCLIECERLCRERWLNIIRMCMGSNIIFVECMTDNEFIHTKLLLEESKVNVHSSYQLDKTTNDMYNNETLALVVPKSVHDIVMRTPIYADDVHETINDSDVIYIDVTSKSELRKKRHRNGCIQLYQTLMKKNSNFQFVFRFIHNVDCPPSATFIICSREDIRSFYEAIGMALG